jgi:hypothetical protein
LAITALLAFSAGQVAAEDTRGPDNAFAAEVSGLTTMPTGDHSDISRSAVTLTPYDWKTSDAEHRAMEWPTKEPTMLYTILTGFVPVLSMLGTAIFVLVFAYRSMRAQMRRERIHYRPRGPVRPLGR